MLTFGEVERGWIIMRLLSLGGLLILCSRQMTKVWPYFQSVDKMKWGDWNAKEQTAASQCSFFCMLLCTKQETHWDMSAKTIWQKPSYVYFLLTNTESALVLDVEVRSTLEFDVITMNIHFLSEDVIVYFSIIRGGSSMPEHKGKLNRSKIRKDTEEEAFAFAGICCDSHQELKCFSQRAAHRTKKKTLSKMLCGHLSTIYRSSVKLKAHWNLWNNAWIHNVYLLPQKLEILKRSTLNNSHSLRRAASSVCLFVC